MSLPFDVSGSLSKNRFRLELLWGISKLFDIYDSDDFAVIFDYACDIEIHLANKFEFYQIKTHKGAKVYTIANITKKDKEKSILGKLMLLDKNEDKIEVKLGLVSNSYLKDAERTYTQLEEIKFSDICEKSANKIIDLLKLELNSDEINISKLFYIFTPMNLVDPVNEIIGQIVVGFEKIIGSEPKKPNALYRLISDTVSGKACYELTINDYDDLVKRKGLTKAEFTNLLNCHVVTADNSIKITKEYIEASSSFKEKYKMKVALSNLLSYLQVSIELQQLEVIIVDFIKSCFEKLPEDFNDCVAFLYEKFKLNFSVEYSDVEIHVFIVLLLKRFEEGVYDENSF